MQHNNAETAFLRKSLFFPLGCSFKGGLADQQGVLQHLCLMSNISFKKEAIFAEI